jgi:hemerythrin-like domain-containing protein
MANAIMVLKDDHEKGRELLSDLELTPEEDANRRDRLLAEAERLLLTHARVEEELFYPAYRDAVEAKGERDIVAEAQEEHHVAEIMLTELKGIASNTEQFTGKARALKDIVDHHMTEEENLIFPKIQDALTLEELENLGKEIENRKQELQDAYPRFDLGTTGGASTTASAKRRERR